MSAPSHINLSNHSNVLSFYSGTNIAELLVPDNDIETIRILLKNARYVNSLAVKICKKELDKIKKF